MSAKRNRHIHKSQKKGLGSQITIQLPNPRRCESSGPLLWLPPHVKSLRPQNEADQTFHIPDQLASDVVLRSYPPCPDVLLIFESVGFSRVFPLFSQGTEFLLHRGFELMSSRSGVRHSN
jgi:hypothetical protein